MWEVVEPLVGAAIHAKQAIVKRQPLSQEGRLYVFAAVLVLVPLVICLLIYLLRG